MAVPPPPNLRMMHAAIPPSSSPAQLILYGGHQPPIPRPAVAPLPLAGVPPHGTPFNIPPPSRQLPRWFTYVHHVLRVMYNVSH